MTSFDSWEAGVCPSENSLMHWGIRGMKHGRRRYQNEDGTWTQEGLEARRKREGFGDSKEIRRAERKIAKAERRKAKAVAKAERAEEKRKRSIKGLTDQELQQKINRLKMEQEYRDLSQSPALKTGKEIVNRVLSYKESRDERVAEINRQKIEMAKIEVQRLQAQNSVKKAVKEAEKARYDAKAAKSNSVTAFNERKNKAKRYTAKKDYLGAKKAYKQAKKNHWKTGDKNNDNNQKSGGKS